MEEIRFKVKDRFANERKEVVVEQAYMPSFRARMATQIIEKFALLVVQPDGEDTAGRQKMKLPFPGDLVARACNIADLAVTEFEERGWLEPVPSLEELRLALAEVPADDDDD